MKKNEQSNISWEIVAILTVLLFLHGAYSATDFIPVALGLSALLLISIIYKLVTKSATLQLNWLSVACFAIAVSFALTLFQPVSIEQSGLKVTEWLTYGLLFLWLPKYRASIVHNSLLAFSCIFVLAHVVLLFGAFSSEGGVLRMMEGYSITGIRLNGWLQYANATGAIAGALWIYFIQAGTQSKKWRGVELVSLLGLPFILFLSESRGALLVIMVVAFIGIVLRKEMLPCFLFSSVAAILAYIAVVLISSNAVGFIAALLILVVAGTISLKSTPLVKLMAPAKLKSMKLVVLGIVAVSITIVVVLKFDALLNRFSLATLTDRIIYVQDAWQAILDNPLLGYGGEAWEFVKYSYQSAPYIVNDLHMFYVQHLLETGFVGLAVLVIVLGVGLYFVSKIKPLLLLPIAVLIVHACIDFTLSYSLSIILLLLFFYEALGEKNEIPMKPAISYIIVTTLSIGIGIVAFCWQQAEQSYKVFATTGNEQALEKAIEMNPYRANYYFAKVHDQSLLEDDIVHYEKMLQLEPYSAHIHFYLAEAYEMIDIKKALQHYKLALTYDKFDRLKYERATEALARINTTEANELKDHIQLQYEQLQNSAAALKVRDQRDFFNDKD